MASPKPRSALPTAAEHNDMVGKADLIDVKLIKSAFNVEAAFFGLADEKQRLLYNCDLEIKHLGEEPKMLMGFYNCEAGCKPGRKWLLRVKATFLVVYHVEGEPSEAAATEFLERVGKFTCFPYFRSHVAQLAATAGAELPPLPVLKGNLPTRIREPAIEGRAKKKLPSTG